MMKVATKEARGRKAFAAAIAACACSVCLFSAFAAGAEGFGAAESAGAVFWPEPSRDAMPWANNWWISCDVDEPGLEYQFSELADKGFGGVRVVPLGEAAQASRADAGEPSAKWKEACALAERKAREYGLGIVFDAGFAPPPSVCCGGNSCETPAQVKADADAIFLSGFATVCYCGFCYSSIDAAWPGWSFSAPLEMGPRNPLWREIGAVNAYLTRCQAMFLEWERDDTFCPDAAEGAFGSAGVLATRWNNKNDGKIMYFAVNTGETPVEIRSDAPFTVMNPMSGMVRATGRVRLEPKHSRFLIGDGFSASESGALNLPVAAVVEGPWRVEPLQGGPAMPAVRILKRLDSDAGWEAWDDSFSGTMLYSAVFDCDPEARLLDLGDVREIARVRLNGLDLGVRFMKPYRFFLPPGLLKEKGNTLEVEVTGTGANRLRWSAATGAGLRHFTAAGAEKHDAPDLGAAAWRVSRSGLLGPVAVLK